MSTRSPLKIDHDARRKQREAHNARVKAESDAQKERSAAYHGPEFPFCYDRACPCKPPPKQHDVSALPNPYEAWQALHREWCARVMRDAAERIERRRWWQR